MIRLLIPSDWQARGGNNFDAVRLAMALLVVWSHSFALYLGTEASEPLSLLFNGTYNSGNAGVMVFFIISGFLVSHSYRASRSPGQYMARRIRRIYPGYLAATSLCAFVIVPLFSSVANLSAWEVAKTLGGNLLLRNYFPPSNAFTANPVPNAINGSLWSIPFEFWCYIGVAGLGLTGLLKRKWVLVFLTVTLLCGRVGLDLLDKKPSGGLIETIFGWPYMWFKILPSFLLGMIAFAFQDRLPRSRALLAALLLAAIGAAHLVPHVADLLVAPALAYATFHVAFSSTINLHGIARSGDFSYGTYLYAFPIQQMLMATHGQTLGLPVFILSSMGLSLIAGVMSWHLVEKWAVVRRPKARSLEQGSAAMPPRPAS